MPGRVVADEGAVVQAVVLHRQQLHSKLVQIMRERLAKALKSFHSASLSWTEGLGPLSPSGTPRKPVAPLLAQVRAQRWHVARPR